MSHESKRGAYSRIEYLTYRENYILGGGYPTKRLPNSLAKQTHRRDQAGQLKGLALALVRSLLLDGFDSVGDGAEFLGRACLVRNVEAIKTVVR